MATFRCKRSGNTVSFTNENDIRGLRVHEGYIEVKEVVNEVKIRTDEESHADARSSMPDDAQTEIKENENGKEIEEVQGNRKEEVLIPEFTKKRGRPKKSNI